MCIDHPEVQRLVGQIEDRRIITYGENPQADVRFEDIRAEGGSTRFSVVIHNRRTDDVEEISNLLLPMPGHHNVSNATAAIAVASALGIESDQIRDGLANFSGCLLYTSPSPRDQRGSRMPSSA